MSTTTTKQMIALYNQEAATVRFFAGMFRSPRRNFHSSEEVEIDIIRSGEDVSIAIQDLSVGYRMNSTDVYTNKSFIPPIHKEAIALNSHDLIKRMPGQTTFQSPNFRGNVVTRAFDGMRKVERKIGRAIELQASQVLQLGKVTLADTAGDTIYAIDYKPKATHFPTAGTSWASETGAGKVDDIDGLAQVIRGDGLTDPDQLIMGVDAYRNFFEDDDVRTLFDTRRIDQGSLAPMRTTGAGGIFRGIVEIANYRYDVWTYDGRYALPTSGASTPFLDPGKIIIRASSGRMDATFGAIPNIGRELGMSGANLIPEMPGRFSNVGGGMDLFANIWLSNDGEQLFAGVGARPLMIPTAIDTYGCLNTQL